MLSHVVYVVALWVVFANSAVGKPRWCCKSHLEYIKCRYLAANVNFNFDCVRAADTDHCMIKIQNNEADLIDLDGGDVFKYRDQITVVAAEDSGSGNARYYAIAVVKANSDPSISLGNLAGRATCHTGVGKTSGWNMPIGWLMRHSYNPSNFRASCAPGAYDPTYQSLLPDKNYAKWCRLCVGDGRGNHVCERDSDETYYSYHGSLNCMKVGGGDVAFMKETTILPAEQDDFMLLCPNLTRAHPSQWSSCNLGRVPSHAVVMKAGTPTGVISHMITSLNNLMRDVTPILARRYGKNLLWSSSTQQFLPAPADPVEYVGHDYFCNMFSLTYRSVHPTC
uniref:Transferrin-like domain-containing protein n=1 Tax=Ciona savignyi TaxID=51511 RepID=H2YHK8_CIOSA